MSAKSTLSKVLAKTEYLVDSRGRPRKVVLDLGAYRALLEELELKEDAEDLDAAIREGEPLLDYVQVREELKRKGKL